MPGGGPIGPSIGEAVLTHLGRGVIRVIVDEMMLIELDEINQPLPKAIQPLSVALYEQEKDGRFVHCLWECGYGNQSMRCFLERGHRGPHLFKLPPDRGSTPPA